jgi:hypothetical protein
MAVDQGVPLGLGGRPGTRWRNLTDWSWWQLVSSLRRPCPDCLRRHGRILPRPWPLPLHPNCRCEQLEVPPGAEAPIQFRTGGELAELVGEEDAANLIGADLELLRRAGLIGWEDVLGDDGLPEDLGRVVRRKRLTVGQLVRAGFPEEQARRAVGR